MKFGSVLLLAASTSLVQGFAPVVFPRNAASTQLYSEPAEEDGLDLNLEEMFEM